MNLTIDNDTPAQPQFEREKTVASNGGFEDVKFVCRLNRAEVLIKNYSQANALYFRTYFVRDFTYWIEIFN